MAQIKNWQGSIVAEPFCLKGIPLSFQFYFNFLLQRSMNTENKLIFFYGIFVGMSSYPSSDLLLD
jgi:hypothetical protein